MDRLIACEESLNLAGAALGSTLTSPNHDPSLDDVGGQADLVPRPLSSAIKKKKEDGSHPKEKDKATRCMPFFL